MTIKEITKQVTRQFQKLWQQYSHSKMIRHGPFNPLVVVVCGATGTGKSKLGIQLAAKFSGEVINADALQLYHGLDIVTNKVTPEECQGVTHHLLGCLDPLTSDNNVHRFRKEALDVVTKLRDRGRMPVVVGGTHYYIESLLWDFLIEGGGMAESEVAHLDTLDNMQLHTLLAEKDPVTADRLHHNDRRKVLRALEIAMVTKTPLDAHLTNQHADPGRSKSGQQRFNEGEAVILWVHCEQDVLEERLNRRVDAMVDAGLQGELEAFHDEYNRTRDPNYTVGIWQSIGFKEFHEFLMLSPAEKESEIGRKMYKDAVERMKISTRQYAKRQIRWLKNRFLRRTPSDAIPVFKLDATDISQWDARIARDAVAIVTAYMGRDQSRLEACGLAPEPLLKEVVHTPLRRVCKECGDKLFVSEEQWTIHVKSRGHQKRMSSLKRKEKAEIETNL